MIHAEFRIQQSSYKWELAGLLAWFAFHSPTRPASANNGSVATRKTIHLKRQQRLLSQQRLFAL